MKHYHYVVWIDHREAHVLSFGMAPENNDIGKTLVRADHMARHLHHKAGVIGSGHAAEDASFYLGVADALKDAGEILLTGPSNAKDHLKDAIGHYDKALAAKIVGVETVDHPSEGQLVDHARKAFKRIDRMLPQT